MTLHCLCWHPADLEFLSIARIVNKEIKHPSLINVMQILYANKLSRGNFKHIAKGSSFEPGLA